MQTKYRYAEKHNDPPEMLDEQSPIDVTISTVKCLLAEAYTGYLQAWDKNDRLKAEFFDGQIRALHRVMEAHGL